MLDETLAPYTRDLTLLYVEDDPVSQLLIKTLMQGQFRRILQAKSGAEGLRTYAEEHPDIILTDLSMPGMDGISMLREIRATDQKTPVLLMTASLDHLELAEAVNLGVSKFVAKPLQLERLNRSLAQVAREIALERLARQAAAQEMELLRFRDRYHSRQQELAQRKEQQINRNELAGLFLPMPGDDETGCVVELLHRPKDIMSGDSYTLRLLPDGRPCLFMADAMGCGLSASVTSMLATAYVNHLLDEAPPDDLPQLVIRTIDYLQRNLLDDEVFSCLFALPDPDGSRLSLALFGVPPLLLLRHGLVERVTGANPPLSSFATPPRFHSLPLDGVTDLLFSTDGLMDAPAGDHPYRQQVDRDFAATGSVAALWRRFQAACPDADDDCTVVRLHRTASAGQTARLDIADVGSLAGIAQLQQRAAAFLTAGRVARQDREQLELALGELLMNAFEHGCLGLGPAKSQRMLDGSYEALLGAASAQRDLTITLRGRIAERGADLSVWFDLQDPGEGYAPPPHAEAGALCGRGLKMAAQSVDLLARTARGNRVVIRKTVGRERP